MSFSSEKGCQCDLLKLQSIIYCVRLSRTYIHNFVLLGPANRYNVIPFNIIRLPRYWCPAADERVFYELYTYDDRVRITSGPYYYYWETWGVILKYTARATYYIYILCHFQSKFITYLVGKKSNFCSENA